jgi:hypothetical protein
MSHSARHPILCLGLAFATIALGFGGTSQAQPAYTSLQPLPGTMEGSPIMVSNNPESVSREGLLLGTDAMVPTVAGTVNRSLTQGTLDGACPAGSMREFAFYMHHLIAAPSGSDQQVDRIFLLIEPAGSSATFNAYGSAISQRDILGDPATTLDPGKSPSYSVSLAALTGTLPSWVNARSDNFGSRFINVSGRAISQPFPLFVLRGTRGASLDARIKIRATSGCLRARVVAASANNFSETLANALSKRQYAWGNVASTFNPDGSQNVFGGAPCTDLQSIGWGRPAGIYRSERWAGSTSVSITSATSSRGWQFLSAPPNQQSGTSCLMNPQTPTPSSASQRTAALRYYSANNSGQSEGRDSDPWSTANYGAEYLLNFAATNRSGVCVTARLQIAAYPGQQACSAAAAKTRHYDGAFKVRTNGVQQPIARAFVRCPVGPSASTIASKVLRPNETVDWNVQGLIPGLISAPAGIVLDTAPAAAASPGC